MGPPLVPVRAAVPSLSLAPLERCARTCGERAWRLAYALLRHADDAYDAVQQAFLAAARKPASVPEDDPWPWFSAVLVNEVRNARRKRRPVPWGARPEGGTVLPRASLQGADEAHGPRIDAREEHARLWAAVEALPEAEREAVVLTFLGGLSHADAAEALGIARQTLSDRVRRGVEDLARRSRRESASLPRALLLLPVAEPPQGLAQALAAWTETVHASLGGAAGAAGGTIVTTTTTKAWLAGLALAAGAGFLGGGATDAAGLFTPRGGAPEREAGAAVLAATGAGPASEPGAPPSLAASAGAVSGEVARLQDLLERAIRRAEAAEQALAARAKGGAGARRGATFTFGEAGKLAAVREADWTDLAQASAVVHGAVVDLLEHAEAGTTAPKELHLALQENVERMRRYEYRTIDRLPTAAQHNGEFTHPISLANLAAARCDDAGKPLDAGQVAEIERLGQAFDADFARLREGWSAGVPRARRMLGEYRLKGAFTQALFAVLTPEQRGLLVEPAFRGLAGLDLNDPTLMILHTTPVLTGASADEVRAKLAALLRKKLALPEEAPGMLDAHLDEFVARTARLLLEPVAKTRARHYTYEQGLVAGEATAALVDGLLSEAALAPAARDALKDDPTWYMPRLVLP